MTDIVLIVRHDAGADTLSYRLHVPGQITEAYADKHLSGNSHSILDALFEVIEETLSSPLAESRDPSQNQTLRRLEGIGEELFEELLPDKLRDWLTRLLGDAPTLPVATLQIQTDETFIPWELLWVPSRAQKRSGGFVAEAFCVTRWLHGHEQTRELPLCHLALVVARESDLPHAEDERRLVRSFENENHRVTELDASYSDVMAAFDSSDYDGWHFTGHGVTSSKNSSLGSLELDDTSLSSHDLRSLANLGPRRPLVFANACHSGRGGPGLTRTGGLARAFVSAGAGAYIGSHWGLYDAPAHEFARFFYHAFLDKELPIGAAVRWARLKTRECFPGDPTWLAYTVFADPLASCRATELGDEPAPVSLSEPGPPLKQAPVRHRRRRELKRLPPVIRPRLAVALATCLPILLYVLGLTTHRSREAMLRISSLNYPVTELLWTGGEALGSLFLNGLRTTFSSRSELRTSAWSLLLLTALVLAASHGRQRWKPAGYLGLVLAASVLWTGVLLYTYALRARHPDERPQDTQALCSGQYRSTPAPITELIVVESCRWLSNPNSTNEEWRQSLSGLQIFFLLASLSALWCGVRMDDRGSRYEHLRRVLLGAHLVVLLLILRQLPAAHAYYRWGLEYKPVTVTGTCEPALAQAIDIGTCCAYDVSAGADDTALLIRGSDCQLASERWPWDEKECSLERGNSRVVLQGCG